MKKITIAILMSIAVMWGTIASAATDAVPAPYVAAEVDQLSMWIGLGLSALLGCYFVAEVVAGYKRRATWTAKQIRRSLPVVGQPKNRHQTSAERLRLVWSDAGHGVHGVN